MILRLAAAIVLLFACSPPWSLGAQQRLARGEVELAYWSLAPSSDLPKQRLIVVVHGGPGVAHGYLRPELDRLTSWGEVVYYDQRGCGSSSKAASYTWEDHVGDLHTVIESLRNNRSVVLVGSSWGSTIIGWYLKTHENNVEGAVSSGAYRGSPIPEAIERRLTNCADANAAIILAVRGKGPTGVAVNTRTLDFVDSGPSGPTDVGPIIGAAPRWTFTLPSHDPWYTHTTAYFEAVRQFFNILNGAN